MKLIRKPINENQIIKRMTMVSIVGNVLLSGFKLLAGLIGHSGAMLSDAVHSMSDVITTIIAAIGVKISHAEADEEHPYGHDRIECVASLLLALILFATGCTIGKNGLANIISGNFEDLQPPGVVALVAALASIIVKEAMCRYTLHYAKKIHSSAFEADAHHHRSDALSSVGALIGIGGARIGYPVMDSVASVFICLFILKTAFDIFKEALDQMIDHSCGEVYDQEMKEYVLAQNGVRRVDLLQSRKFGSKVYVDLEISVDGDMPLKEAHEIAENIHDKVEKKYPQTKHVMIHVNPYSEENNG